MLTFLWLIGDLVLIVVAFPLVMFLLYRIIKPLKVAHQALVSISGSARSITSSLPPAITEISAVAQTAGELR